MLDFSHLPTSNLSDTQIFKRPSTITNTQWTTWLKPRGKTMGYFIAIGGGGGGGAGFGAAAGAARGGGGGGGGASIGRLLVPLFMIPDRLYIQVGAGGLGATSGLAAAGIPSFVSLVPDSTTRNILAGSNGGNGGGTGTGAAAGTAGTAGAIVTSTGFDFGINLAIAGNAGAAGGVQGGAVGGSYTQTNSGMPGGAGGAGSTSADFAGGGYTAAAGLYINSFAPAVAPAGSNPGAHGRSFNDYFYHYSGFGGGSSNTTVGGPGGYGGIGAGGGGGGAGVTTGGRGGDGGSGIVIIVCW
jgi:hypothetical protein